MIEKYEHFLELLDTRLLQVFFERQKDYIHCKSGCSLCCESGEYPFSEIEFRYVMIGYNTLSENEKIIVKEKVLELKALKSNSSNDEFMYECPFLIDKKCSIYKYRGIICRTHGLIYYLTDNDGNVKNKAPKCVYFGLNYSNVYDKTTKTLSVELWEKTGIKTEPVGYNIGLKTILNSDLAKGLELKFGAEKALIDWFY